MGPAQTAVLTEAACGDMALLLPCSQLALMVQFFLNEKLL